VSEILVAGDFGIKKKSRVEQQQSWAKGRAIISVFPKVSTATASLAGCIKPMSRPNGRFNKPRMLIWGDDTFSIRRGSSTPVLCTFGPKATD
jgi:hypothetical protein